MRILIIEDDEKLCEAMRFALEREGYTVDVCHDGDNGFRWAREQAHDLILLDRMLPSADGVELLKRLRAQGHTAPVLLVTALGGIGQRVEGLDAGADDYLVKPFAVEELLARVRAMQRRPRQWESARVIQVGDAAFDAAQKTLTGPGGGCSLSKREAALMEILLANHGQTLPRSMLLTRVWGPDAEVEDGNLDNYIHFLRRRLKAAGSTVSIRTVRGVGYQLEDGCV
ncbi:DNA-binding response regulator [Anaerotruncus colihominis]|uniref:Stage 0 sporulation protein A homolog n=1 Tax=Anaerotruncus colihominis TaxID=169435 RepID=A0A845RLR1_9FIRM|nr:response regulator transcription factor [Anaerotruncus colihominis]NBI79775.1 DNA-binding response regulator [Anaerotruncus colihominis]